MKPKALIALALSAFAFAACSEQEQVKAPDTDSVSSVSHIRSIDEAIAIAQHAISGDCVSRSDRTLKSRDAATVITKHHSRSEAGDTLIYALDLEDNQGFVLVAAPRSVEPILAIIDQGSYNDPENLNNEPYQLMLQAAEEYVIDNIVIPTDTIGGRLPFDFTIPEFVVVEDIEINHNPLVEVSWGEFWPENIFCPNGRAGCTPIAIAQMYSYFECPQLIFYHFDDYPVSSEYLEWTGIKFYVNYMNNNASLGNLTSLASLIREIGYRAQSTYGNGGTSTTFSRVQNVISQMTGMNPNETGTGTLNLFNALLNHEGVAIVGNIGHTFIADAVKYRKYRMEERVYDFAHINYEVRNVSEFERKLIHFNWGSYGNCNGYFYYNLLDLSRAYSYDFAENSSDLDFTNTTPSYHLYYN